MKILTRLLLHSEASYKDLEQIANLKALRWNYPLEEQFLWMKRNLKPKDIHHLIYIDAELVGYNNFAETKVFINDLPESFIGIGNVCTKESGLGYGEILLNAINETIINAKWKAILLCHDNLIPYYEKYNWKFIRKLNKDNILLFNYDKQILTIMLKNNNF